MKTRITIIFNFFLFFISSCQILKILDEKEKFPILKNVRKINTLIDNNKNLRHRHSYDVVIEKESNCLEREEHFFPNFMNEDNINFIDILNNEKKKLVFLGKKEKELSHENKIETRFIDKELNKLLLKMPEVKKNPVNSNYKYLKEFESKREFEMLRLKLINNNINLFRKKLKDVDFSSEQDWNNPGNFKFVSNLKAENKLSVLGKSKFSNIISKEIETKNIRISAIEDYFYIKNKNKLKSDIFNQLLTINKINEQFLKNCGEDFKLCFVSNEDILEKEQEMVINEIFLLK